MIDKLMVRAQQTDLQDVMHMYAECIKDMQQAGIFQWDENYPSADKIAGDIAERSLFVIRAGDRIDAAAVLNELQEPEYRDVNWRCGNAPNLIVHRLAVRPQRHKQGVANNIMDFVERFGRENNYVSIRLDTYSGNFRAVNLYKRLGYDHVGEVFFRGKKLPFFCFEKAL